MFKWLKNLIRPYPPDVIDVVSVSADELTNKDTMPNGVIYKFPDPLGFKCYKVKFKDKKRKRKKK